MAPDDSMPARISPDCPQDTRDVLHHAWAHDVTGLKRFLGVGGRASAQDPRTGETPLHVVIRDCGPAAGPDDADDGCVGEAKEALRELFLSGAIWNDVDANDETPGCVARRLGRKALYDLCVDAGVRAELLFALMDGYEELSSGSEAADSKAGAGDEAAAGEQDAAGSVTAGQDAAGQDTAGQDTAAAQDEHRAFVPPAPREKPVTSDQYLKSTLTYDPDKLLDADRNGFIMAWETDIMRCSVAALVPSPQSGRRILNIGFGMGIVDALFADLAPARHHIIEAHPAILAHAAASRFGPDWEKAGPRDGAYKLLAGRWQDVAPRLLDQGETYDAIYFDTFGEDYAQLRLFFTEYVPGLDPDGRFSFNGLGADRSICYDFTPRWWRCTAPTQVSTSSGRRATSTWLAWTKTARGGGRASGADTGRSTVSHNVTWMV